MSDEMQIEGKPYISSKRASELSGYAQDYIGQLARKIAHHAVTAENTGLLVARDSVTQ